MAQDKKTILLIDDEEDLLSLLKVSLEDEGYRVLTANTGEKGLELAQKERPDLILLDVILPRIGGWEVCRRLKEEPGTSGIPVFFLTAKRSIDDEMIGLSLAASDYITKPFEPDELKNKIRNYLSPENNQKKKKILVIDDDPSIQKLIKVVAEREGYLAITADNGLEGIDKAASEAPDVILLDVLLPNINGWEVCRRLKEEPKTREIPIIFITVKKSEEDRRLGVSLGGVDYITKPFNVEEVIRNISKLFS